ncbi:MFS transporter [Candidatus Bathyarchaeota archaeon]|nr:MFS transporter [Candidatus Bathyarchaeota archaeon]
MGEEEGQRQSDRRIWLLSQGIGAFGSSLLTPYLGVYAVQLGANPAEMGWFRSLDRISRSTTQLVWGGLMDRIGRPLLLVFIANFLGAITILPLLFVSSPREIIIIVFLLGFIGAMGDPSTTAANDSLAPRSKRNQALGELHAVYGISSIPALLLAGYIMSQTRDNLRAMYFQPIVMSVAICAGASLLLWPIMRREKQRAVKRKKGLFSNVGRVLQDRNLRTFYSISFFSSFFLWFPHSLFPIANVLITKNDMFLISLLSITNTAVSSLTRPYFGQLADKFGQKRILVLGKISMALTPLIYAVATEPWHLLVAHVSWGITTIANTMTQAYMLEHANPEMTGTSLAVHATIAGVAGFLAPLTSGYLANELLFRGFTQTRVLSIGFFFTAGARTIDGILHLKLKDERRTD